jgi:hypothetical protein
MKRRRRERVWPMKGLIVGVVLSISRHKVEEQKKHSLLI